MQHRNRQLKVALGDLVFENIKSLLQEAHLSCQGWLENFSCHGAVRASAGRIFLQISFESIVDGVSLSMEEFLNVLLLTNLCFAPVEFFRCANFMVSRQDPCLLSSKGFLSPQIFSYLRWKVMTVVRKVEMVFHQVSELGNQDQCSFPSTDGCRVQQQALISEARMEESSSMPGSLIVHRKICMKPIYRDRNALEVDNSALVQQVMHPCLSVLAGMILQCGIVSSNPSSKTSSRGLNDKRKRVDNPGTRNGSRKKASSSSKPKGQVQQKCPGSSLKETNGFVAKKSDDSTKTNKSSANKARMKGKKKKAISENESNRNEYDKALGRMKGQMSRFRQEQALIMAYDADGWNGASREKVKPHTEIARARLSIAKCLETIRDCIRICDEAGGDKSIPSECFDEEGELDADSIFCGKCLKSDSTDDNDIILCDGICDRAYHMKCIFPPLDASVLEDTSDEGWLCPACDRKIDMIDEINDEFGTDYDYEESWEKILLPDSLPKHEHYDFQTVEECEAMRQISWLDGLELPSEDESDEDFRADNSADSELDSSQDANSNSDSESVDSENELRSCTSEELKGMIKDVEIDALEGVSQDKMDRERLYKHLEDNSPEHVEGKRKRTKVDYKALNQELFGGIESPDMKFPVHGSDSDSDDAVWSPTAKK
ncbi:hypothetical protein M9434_003614 [Picochlorum sp. BPE23]|nr:hypothetical protein M9434_003614 [Picochlorum sp. BPE23]